MATASSPGVRCDLYGLLFLPDIVVVDVAKPSNGNIRRKEHEKLEKYQGLREELEKARKVKATVVPVVICAVTPKHEEWLQKIPGNTSDISVQNSGVEFN
ncbi:hypothetical protein WMY93_028365 [Mugilogobius chulae]|uniref:Uncharacterized protein n=1 Tax=Mugilogobius chulae TaxID=88201 RepID=A0AAW0MZX3_9GOBI